MSDFDLTQKRFSVDRATVHSFDLVSKDDRITVADISHLPLDDSSCDCVVFSLSLMGSNISDQIREAARILKTDGLLIIAEVASRFQQKIEKKDQEKTEEHIPGVDSEESFVSKLAKYNLKLKENEKLKPNDFFVVFQFVRTAGNIKSRGKNSLPLIRLKACEFRPRE